jgi:hypothetical protein
MSEKVAYQTFVRNVCRPGDRIDRIENLVGAGFPDTNGCFNGVEFWMEIKTPEAPIRANTPLFGSNHKLSQEQKNWFLRQRRAKGLAFIYIETEYRRILMSGERADTINLCTINELIALSVWTAVRPTSPDAWYDLREFIAHHG